MKKEVFLAITIGFVLGLIITFGVWTANKSLSQNNLVTPITEPTPAQTTDVTPTPSVSGQISLTITAPEDEALVSTNKITLTGTTSPGAVVVVLTSNGEFVLPVDTNGEFETELSLEGGYNEISVTATDQNGNTITKDLLVTYTTSKI